MRHAAPMGGLALPTPAPAPTRAERDSGERGACLDPHPTFLPPSLPPSLPPPSLSLPLSLSLSLSLNHVVMAS